MNIFGPNPIELPEPVLYTTTTTTTTTMNNLPQNVTSRYVTALLHDGRNADFDLNTLCQKASVVEQETVGYYYEAVVFHLMQSEVGHGATPVIALRRALEKFGVTFK